MDDIQVNHRIKQIRLEKGMTQKGFADEIQITQGNLSLIESGKTVVTLSTVKLIHDKFDISYDWLIDGKKDLKANSLIPLIDKSAMAGYPSKHGISDFENSLALYKIPGFENGEHRIFEIEGESMLPTLLPHEYIIAAKIIDKERIVSGSLCVIVTKNEIIAKRIHQITRETYLLESDNKNYRPITYKRNTIIEIWGVVAKLTQSFQKPMSPANELLETMQYEIEQLKKDVMHLKNNNS